MQRKFLIILELELDCNLPHGLVDWCDLQDHQQGCLIAPQYGRIGSGQLLQGCLVAGGNFVCRGVNAGGGVGVGVGEVGTIVAKLGDVVLGSGTLLCN